jgi:hypothetical protein
MFVAAAFVTATAAQNPKCILGHINQLRVLASYTVCRANQACVGDVQDARDAASGLVSEKEKLAREAQRLQEVRVRRVDCVACV